MKKIKFTKTNLSGNTTAFIWNEIQRTDQAKLSANLMKPESLSVEQIGFVEKPTKKSSIVRLQMMGGEISINATLSLVYILALKRKQDIFQLELSGYPYPIDCILVNNQPKITMKSLYKISKIKLQIAEKSVMIKLVDLIGIAYFLVDRNSFVEEIDYQREFKKIKDQVDKIQLPPAWGVIFYKRNRIQPVVYVSNTSSIVCENACGSGSLALSLAFNYRKIIQPTGEIIEVKKNNNEISISGKVKVIAEGYVNI